jgi:hypothetical protein
MALKGPKDTSSLFGMWCSWLDNGSREEERDPALDSFWNTEVQWRKTELVSRYPTVL